jgi:UrcA family protein
VSALIATAFAITPVRADESVTAKPLQSVIAHSDFLSKTVNFEDLDLSRPPNVGTLYRRISGAAERVCAPLESRDLDLDSKHKACMTKAVSNAVVKVNVPSLTSYASNRGMPVSNPELTADR